MLDKLFTHAKLIQKTAPGKVRSQENPYVAAADLVSPQAGVCLKRKPDGGHMSTNSKMPRPPSNQCGTEVDTVANHMFISSQPPL